jgi:hypothetical protein
MPVIEYSSMCLNEDNCLKKINDAKLLVKSAGFDFGVQLHNSIGRGLYDKIIGLKNEIKLSVHSPLFSKYFFNLANTNFDFLKTLCDDNIKHLKEVGTDIFFFHAFFMTEKQIVHDMKNYRKTLLEGIGDLSSLNGSFIMNPEFFKTEIFYRYKKTFMDNYDRLAALYPEFVLALENDFVGIGSGLQRPEEILDLIDNLWFDLGHFWCSSLVHEFDFYAQCEEVIEKKNIVGVHINHNFMTHDTPKEKIRDSHGHIYQRNEQELKPVLRKLLEKGNEIFTLEIVDGDIEDVKTLLDWLS